jgi:O-acetylserine/cysteine efflux transporter
MKGLVARDGKPIKPTLLETVVNDRVNVMMTALVITWGIAFASIKALGTVLDPFQITWFRYIPFLFLFGGWLLWKRRDRFRQVEGADWIRFAIVGALGVLGYHFPLNWGLQTATGATGAILVATTPLWTLFFGVIRGKEALGPKRLFGSLLAFAGVTVVVLLGKGPAQISLNEGTLIMLMAPILWSLYSIIGKPLVDKYGAQFFTGVSMCLGILTLVPYGIQQGFSPLAGFTPILWFWLAYVSLLATVVGYAVWNWALKQRSAAEVTVFIYFVPVVATLAGWVFVGETVTLWFLGGAAMVLAGVATINRARQSH